jgi:hypothetical protein
VGWNSALFESARPYQIQGMKRHYRIPLKRENLRLSLLELRCEFRKAYQEMLSKHMDSYRQILVDKAAASIAEDMAREAKRAESDIMQTLAQAELAENERIAKLLADSDPELKTARAK